MEQRDNIAAVLVAVEALKAAVAVLEGKNVGEELHQLQQLVNY